MAKTIMIANDVYEELKAKKRERSFSQLLKELLHNTKVKKGRELRSCLGSLKKDEKSMKLNKVLKKGWKSWSKKYV